jgi:hypothetical protein
MSSFPPIGLRYPVGPEDLEMRYVCLAPLGHVNRYLQQQPVDFEALLNELEWETMLLARDPYNPDESYWREVVTLRLRIGEASVAAAHAAMLHCGARGYVPYIFRM